MMKTQLLILACLLVAASASSIGANAAAAGVAGGVGADVADRAEVELVEAEAVPIGGARRLLALPDPARTLTAASNCAGWPEPRIYVEGQAWFTRPGEDIDVDSSHLHVGACVPHRQRVRGALTLHVLVQKHQFPDNATARAPVDLSFEFKTQVSPKTEAKYAAYSKALASTPPPGSTGPWTCTNGGALCKAVAVVTVQTLGSAVFVPDGPTTMTMLATTGGFNDGKGRRSLQARIGSKFVVDNKG